MIVPQLTGSEFNFAPTGERCAVTLDGFHRMIMGVGWCCTTQRMVFSGQGKCTACGLLLQPEESIVGQPVPEFEVLTGVPNVPPQ